MENSIDIVEVNPDMWIKNAEIYKSQIADRQIRNKIPLVNANALHLLQDNRLVRFRGMIQDMHNPEFYFESFEIRNKTTKEIRVSSGKYRDTADVGDNEAVNYNSSSLKSAERQTMVTISLPGFNDWAQKIENEASALPNLKHPPGTSKNGNCNSASNLKRTLEEVDDEKRSESMDTVETGENSNNDRKKSVKTEECNGANNQNISHDHIINFPLPDVEGKVCLLKVYDDADVLKLNDMVEVVGFLSVDPVLGSDWNGSKNNQDEDMDVETLTHNPPPSLVPRIHAIHIELLKHCNPLMEQTFDKVTSIKEANECREHLRIALSQLLFGDTLAADYLICHLISCVYLRRDVLALGKFSLNFSNIPTVRYPQYTEMLYSIIQDIVTKSYYLPLTIENMNTFEFLPKKDYTCNRLTSGILQLSKNTHLVLDETKLQPGQLNSAGVLNIAALGNMMETQKNQYDFKFYKMDYDCDIPVLVLSEGKSLLPNDFYVPIVPDESCMELIKEIVDSVKFYLNKDLLKKLRIFLTSMKLADYSIEEEPKYVQEDFVNMRRSVNGVVQNATADDLHKLLVLARYVCLSRGFSTLNKECWDIAKEMEEKRSARLQK